MPVIKAPNGKYRIGSGPAMYKSKASAERANAAYRAKKYSEVKVGGLNAKVIKRG